MSKGTGSSDALSICVDLFNDFHDREIRYCHWKSNEHLAEGLEGITDLDIIVDRDQDVGELLARNGFKRFETAWFATYPSMEDYLGFDAETGRLVHLHLHYRLAIGNKRLKHYHLPWEDLIFSRRIYDQKHGVYRADPEIELLLLFVRYALKIQVRDYLRTISGEYLSQNVVREYEWLLERAESDEVVRLASSLLNDDAAVLVESMLQSQPTLWQLRKLRSVCREELSEFRTYGFFEAKARGFRREVFLGLRSINRRFLGRPRFYRRTVPSGGVVIVLMGVDGAGKSTLISKLEEWLSWKIDVQQIYYGSGDGSATLLRYPLIAARNRVGGDGGSASGPSSDRSLVMRVGRVLRGLVLARERRLKLRKGWRAKNRGLVILGDRYPQNQIMGFTDGPLLDHLSDSSSRLLRHLSRLERAVYRSADRNPPDLVIKLDVSPEVSRDRKPEMPLEQLRRRVEAVESIEFDTDIRVVDAEQPLEKVIRDIKEIVWETI